MAAIPKGVLESALNLEDRAHDDALAQDITGQTARLQQQQAMQPPTPQWSLPSLDSLLGGGTTQPAPETQQQAVPTQPVQQEQRTQGWQLPSLDVLLGRDPNARPEPAQVAQQQAPAASGAPVAMPTGGEQTATQAPRPMAAASSGGNHGEIDNSSREAFVRTAYPYMLEAAGGDQNLAELMLAKAISENGSIGTGRPFWANNFSGIKGEGDAGSVEADTWEDYGNGPVNIRDRFAAYSTPQAGMAAFMQFLRDNSRYHPALARYEQTRDASQLFRDIRAAGYATDPIWAEKVESIRESQVAPITRGQSNQDMPRLSLNAAQPPAPGGSAAPPAPAGVSSAPAGAPPAPWEQPGAQDGGPAFMKAGDDEYDPRLYDEGPRELAPTPVNDAMLPGDGGVPPTPEYDPRDADSGPRESRPQPIQPTDITASDPAYTQNPNAAPMVDPLDPSTITPSALPPLSNGPRMMQPQAPYRDPREDQGVIARGIDAVGQLLPSAPIVDTKPGDAGAFMGGMPNTPGKLWEWRGRVAEGAADALSRGTGMDPDALVLNVEVGGIPLQMTVSELLENVTDPLLAAGWGVGDMVLDAAGRAVLRLVAPYAKGAARETIGRLLNSEPMQRGVEAVREGAEAVGRGLQGVGREVAGALDANAARVAAADARMAAQGSTTTGMAVGPTPGPRGARQVPTEPWQMTREQFAQQPVVRVVGEDIPDAFLHGTARRNIPTLTAAERPDGTAKPSSGSAISQVFGNELNEFRAAMLLSEPRQPHQAMIFGQGRGNALAEVRLKPGTRILDLSDEATRTAPIGFGGEPPVLRFFERPAITDDFIDWHLGRISEGYKQRNPNWAELVRAEMDPASPEFNVRTWQQNLVAYAKARGYGAVRLADETLVTDRAVLADARPLRPAEVRALENARAYEPATPTGLFTGKPTGARTEAHRAAVERALARGERVPPDVLAEYPDLARSAGAMSTVAGSPGPRNAAIGTQLATDAGNALAGSMVGAIAPADTPEERLRNTAIGAAGFPVAGRLMRRAGGALGTPGIGPNGGRPQQRTVEWLAEQIDYTKRVLDDLDPATEGELIGQVQDRLARLQGEWVDAVNARRALEPRIRSEVGRRVNELPIDERTASDYAGIGRERVSPEAGVPRTVDDTPRSPGLNSAPAYNGRGVGIGAQAAADVGASLQGGVVGAAAGYGMPADSEEERRRNALAFGAAGMVGMPIAGRAVGRGMRGAGAGTRAGIVPPHVADQMGDTFPVRVPTDPKVIRAIESIGGTVDPERGVTINVTRAQGPQAAGQTATRGGVFYEAVPPGGRSENFVRGSDDPTGVGGSQVIPARPTRFRSPLIVSDAPGGTRGFDETMERLRVRGAPADDYEIRLARADLVAAQERLGKFQEYGMDAESMGRVRDAVRVAEERLRRLQAKPLTSMEVNAAIQEARQAGPEGSEARAQALKEVVRRYGGDPELIDPLLRVRGADASESEWAIRENILAAHARRNGYDGVVTVERASVPLDELSAHPAVKAADEAEALAEQELNAAQRAADALRRQGASRDELNKAADREIMAGEAWRAAQEASASARVKAREELARGRITELADVREGRNPTPGRLNPLLEERERAIARIEEITRDVMANPSRSPEESTALVQEITALRQRLKEIEPELPAAEANRYTGDPGFSVRSDIPRPPGANWAGVPLDPASAAAGGYAGSQVEGEDGEAGDPIKTLAGMGVAGVAGRMGRGRGVRQTVREAVDLAEQARLARLNPGGVQASMEGFGPPSDILKMFQERYSDPRKAERAALEYQRMLEDGASEEQIANFLRSAQDGRLLDRFNTIRYASMLSDPKTHGQNSIGSLVMGALDMANTPFAVLADVIRSRVTGAPRETFMSEMPARLAGWGASAGQGLRDAAFIMRNGLRPQDVTKLDQPNRGFATNIPGLAPAGSRAADTVDAAMELPMRALAAADAFWRGTFTGGHLAAEAIARATRNNAGKPPSAEQIAKAMLDPDVIARADAMAARSVLQESRHAAEGLNKYIQGLPDGVQAVVSTVMPYIRTPFNIVAQGVGMTPLGLISLAQDIRAGKPTREINQRVGRLALGTMAMGWAGWQNMQGNLTGPYPENEAERSTLPPGWRPWSYKVTAPGVGTQYVPIGVFGPVAVPMVASILMTEGAKRGQKFDLDRAAKVAQGIGQFAEDQTFLRSLADLSEAFEKGGDTMMNYVERLSTQASPHIVGGGGVGRRIQEILGMPQRDPEGVIEALMATHPALAGLVPPKRDVLGRQQQSGPSGALAVQPFVRSSQERDAPVLRAYRQAKVSLPRGAPKDYDPGDGSGRRPLSRRQRESWKVAYGQALQSEWSNAGSPSDPAELRRITETARERALSTVTGR